MNKLILRKNNYKFILLMEKVESEVKEGENSNLNSNFNLNVDEVGISNSKQESILTDEKKSLEEDLNKLAIDKQNEDEV